MIDDRIKDLLGLIARINSTISLDELLGSIMESTKSIMQAEASSLMLLDKETQELVVALPTGPAKAEISGKRIPPGKGFAGWVAEHKKPILVNDPQNDPRFLGEISSNSGFTTKSLVCVPLRNAEGEVIGVLQAVNRLIRTAFDDSDLDLMVSLANQAAIAIEREKLVQKEIVAQRYSEQLETARAIQYQFIPKSAPEISGYAVHGMSDPAQAVGGDYLDFLKIDGGRFGFVIADVVGKGVPAALLMANLRSTLRTIAFTGAWPQDIITQVNEYIIPDLKMGQFITLFYGELEVATNKFRYVNAGHNPPMLLHGKSGAISELTVGGPIIGIMKNCVYEEGSVILEPGDLVCMYTDGVTEAMNDSHEQFDEQRLRNVLLEHKGKSPKAVVEAINKAINAFTGPKEPDDDRTMIALLRQEAQ
jgi:sigma-B regulation protein RsbU (phosphoserine phosphatase)